MVPSGYVNSLLLKMAIEIVSFPIKNGDVPQFFVCLPEGMIVLPTLEVDNLENPWDIS